MGYQGEAQSHAAQTYDQAALPAPTRFRPGLEQPPCKGIDGSRFFDYNVCGYRFAVVGGVRCLLCNCSCWARWKSTTMTSKYQSRLRSNPDPFWPTLSSIATGHRLGNDWSIPSGVTVQSARRAARSRPHCGTSAVAYQAKGSFAASSTLRSSILKVSCGLTLPNIPSSQLRSFPAWALAEIAHLMSSGRSAAFLDKEAMWHVRVLA